MFSTCIKQQMSPGSRACLNVCVSLFRVVHARNASGISLWAQSKPMVIFLSVPSNKIAHAPNNMCKVTKCITLKMHENGIVFVSVVIRVTRVIQEEMLIPPQEVQRTTHPRLLLLLWVSYHTCLRFILQQLKTHKSRLLQA